MLDRLVAAGQFRDCFIFLPEGSQLSGYTDHSRAVVAEEDSIADPPPRFSVSPPSYVMPSCESEARAKSAEADDPFKDRELPGRGHCAATADTFASLDFWSPCHAEATLSSRSVFPTGSIEQGMLGSSITASQEHRPKSHRICIRN